MQRNNFNLHSSVPTIWHSNFTYRKFIWRISAVPAEPQIENSNRIHLRYTHHRRDDRNPVLIVSENCLTTDIVHEVWPGTRAESIPVNLKDVGELFCGAGGMGFGFKQAGFVARWGVEIDEDACSTYEANVAKSICSKVEDVDFKLLSPVAGLAFGFPCNDFSLVGERKGTLGYFGGLYKEAIRALNEVRPFWFIAENVPGLMSSGGDSILKKFSRAGRGYDVAVHLYKFDQYGVPQKRARIVAVGIATELEKRFRVPAPTHKGNPVTAQQALAGVDVVAHNNERTKHPARTVEMLSYIPEGQNAWHKDVPERLRIATSVKLSLIYRRLHRDEPAYTVVAAGGGGTHIYHYDEDRALTNRERARLQSFPDGFVFTGRTGSVRKQIGMAVPPLAARVIADALWKTFLDQAYPSCAPSHGYISIRRDPVDAVS